jgi:hypothetical protein
MQICTSRSNGQMVFIGGRLCGYGIHGYVVNVVNVVDMVDKDGETASAEASHPSKRQAQPEGSDIEVYTKQTQRQSAFQSQYSCHGFGSLCSARPSGIIDPETVQTPSLCCKTNLSPGRYDDRRFSTLWPDRFRMRTDLATLVQLSRRSPAFHCGMPTSASMPCADSSYSMSMPSSPAVDDDDEDVELVREVTWLMVHCSSSSIICTSREMSRTCDEQHCMRELDWRCMRRSEAETREYIGRGVACTAPSDVSSSSLGGVIGPEPHLLAVVSMRRFCWLSCDARSPMVHGGVDGRLRQCWRASGFDVGDTFMAARSAS